MSSFDHFNASGSAPASITRLGPLIVGASVAAIALARQSRLAAWFRGFMSVPRARARIDFYPASLDADTPTDELRDSILGRHKAVLMARYGTPHSAAVEGTVIHEPQPASVGVWRADTWYYILDAGSHAAMSIRFERQIACQVDFFDAP